MLNSKVLLPTLTICIFIILLTYIAIPNDIKPIEVRIAGCETKKDGEYVLPLCHESCAKSFWSWSFFVSNYNVGGTIGLGEHQGIYIIGNQYIYDSRFKHSEGKKQSWSYYGTDIRAHRPNFEQITREPIPFDIDKKIASFSDIVSKHALCEHKIVNENYIYNHGRTIAKKPGDGGKGRLYEKGGIPINALDNFTIGPFDYSELNSSENYKINNHKVNSTISCIKNIKDGFCDSVCGNCSYVLPKIDYIDAVEQNAPIIGTKDSWKKITGQTVAFTKKEFNIKDRKYVNVDYVRTCVNRYGGPCYQKNEAHPKMPNAKWDSLVFPDQYFNDPFTHCYYKDSPDAQQAISSRASFATLTERVITGLYGHNSNTDAAAEFKQFNACKINPLSSTKEACDICGITHKVSSGQSPCLDKTNRAQSKWELTDGLHNIDDSNLGKDPFPTAPVCKNNNQSVFGM